MTSTDTKMAINSRVDQSRWFHQLAFEQEVPGSMNRHLRYRCVFVCLSVQTAAVAADQATQQNAQQTRSVSLTAAAVAAIHMSNNTCCAAGERCCLYIPA
jgi:hypothetical protein